MQTRGSRVRGKEEDTQSLGGPSMCLLRQPRSIKVRPQMRAQRLQCSQNEDTAPCIIIKGQRAPFASRGKWHLVHRLSLTSHQTLCDSRSRCIRGSCTSGKVTQKPLYPVSLCLT